MGLPLENGSPPTEISARPDQHDEANTYELSVAERRNHLKENLSTLSDEVSDAIEINHDVILGKKIDYLSSNGIIAREVLLDGEKVGALLTFESTLQRETKSMFVSPERSPDWFETANGSSFPNIKVIETYFADRNAKVSAIMSGPTYESGSQLTGINYDNGISVGSEKLLTENKTKGRGIGYIENGKMILSHSSELSQEKIHQLIQAKRDIFTMSSLKRNGNINQSQSLRNHNHSHTLVQLTDGTIGQLILNNSISEVKKTVLAGFHEIDRALYGDAGGGGDNHLDGMRIQTPKGLIYSHPDEYDIFTQNNIQASTPRTGNMPGILIFYAEQK